MTAFPEACRKDDIAVLGWEVWIINHRELGHFSPGSWTGLIPLTDGSTAVIGGDAGADDVQKQCALFLPASKVAPFWMPHLRVNVTIDA